MQVCVGRSLNRGASFFFFFKKKNPLGIYTKISVKKQIKGETSWATFYAHWNQKIRLLIGHQKKANLITLIGANLKYKSIT